jgi:transposase
MNLHTGTRLFLARHRQTQVDFQEFLKLVHNHYRGWHVVLLLDEDPSHTAKHSRQLAIWLNIELLWLPKRSPELNPMDTLWGHAKQEISANWQYPTIEAHVDDFLEHLSSLSAKMALHLSGVKSRNFWLKSVL